MCNLMKCFQEITGIWNEYELELANDRRITSNDVTVLEDERYEKIVSVCSRYDELDNNNPSDQIIELCHRNGIWLEA